MSKNVLSTGFQQPKRVQNETNYDFLSRFLKDKLMSKNDKICLKTGQLVK